MKSALDSTVLILVEPQSPGNIGMVCRAMSNMGLTQLRIVSGCEHLHPEAYKFAVSARDVLELAQCYSSLEDALVDITTSVATTRRSGKYRQELLTPPQAAQVMLSSTGRSALVLGREDHGLSTTDLTRCSHHATIPTGSEYGSLNLAQAALVFCYELFNRSTEETSISSRMPVASGELEPLFSQMQSTLLRIGYLNPQNPDHIMRSLRRMLFRASLDQHEVAILRGMMSQIDWAASNFSDRKKVS